MATLGYDAFVGTAATDLASHTPSNGAAWTKDTNLAAGAMLLDGSGGVYTTAASAAYYKGDTPAVNGDMIVTGRFLCKSLTANFYVMGRLKTGASPSLYLSGVDAANFYLTKVVAGSPTTLKTQPWATLASGSGISLVVGHTYEVTLTLQGTTIIAQIFDVANPQLVYTFATTDSSIVGAAGDEAGLYTNAAASSTTGFHATYFEWNDVVTLAATAQTANQVWQRTPGGGPRNVTYAGTYTGTPSGQIQVQLVSAAGAWAANTQYDLGLYVSLGGKVYTCKTRGVSASSGGPTGTGTGIVDGTTTWDYVGVQQAVQVSWTSAGFAAGSWSQAISTPEGVTGVGWLQEQVQAVSSQGTVLARANPLPQFGVGILLGSMSDSTLIAPSGSGPYGYTNANHLTMRLGDSGSRTSPAVDPVSTDSTGSPWPALLDDLQQATGTLCAFVYGARGLSPWIPNAGVVNGNTYTLKDCWGSVNPGNHFDVTYVYGRALTFYQAADPSHAPEMILCGGATDVAFLMTRASWLAAFRGVQAQLAADLTGGSQTKWLLAQANRVTTGVVGADANFDTLRQAMLDAIDGSTTYLVSEMASLALSDGIHPTPTAEAEMGHRAARCALFALGLGTNKSGPQMTGLSFGVDNAHVRVAITHHGGSDIVVTAPYGFAVTDSIGTKTISSVTRINATTIEIVTSTPCVGLTTCTYGEGTNPVAATTPGVADNQADPMPMLLQGIGLQALPSGSGYPTSSLLMSI